MGWIDIVFIVVLIIFAIIGLSKGLFDSILSIFSSALSFIAAIFASKYVASFLNNITHCNDFFAKKIVQWGWVSDTGLELFGKFFTPAQIANTITIVISILAVWLLIKLAIALLAHLFDDITSSSTAMSGLNRLFGLVFGAAKGLLIGCIGFGLVSIITICIPSFNNKVKVEMEKNKMSNFFYTYVNEWVANNLEKRIDDILGTGKEPATPPSSGESTNPPSSGESTTPDPAPETTPSSATISLLPSNLNYQLIDTRNFGLKLV